MKNKQYLVIWERTALIRLGKLFNIDHDKVYERSKLILSRHSYHDNDNQANYPGFDYNNYFWDLIQDVIVVYRISDEEETVFVEACYYANTEASHEIFWGIDPDD